MWSECKMIGVDDQKIIFTFQVCHNIHLRLMEIVMSPVLSPSKGDIADVDIEQRDTRY